MRKCQAECENHSENRAENRGGGKSKVELKHKKHEEQVGEKYSAQKAEQALENVILERIVDAKMPRPFVNPSVFHGGEYSAPKVFNFPSASIRRQLGREKRMFR